MQLKYVFNAFYSIRRDTAKIFISCSFNNKNGLKELVEFRNLTALVAVTCIYWFNFYIEQFEGAADKVTNAKVDSGLEIE